MHYLGDIGREGGVQYPRAKDCDVHAYFVKHGEKTTCGPSLIEYAAEQYSISKFAQPSFFHAIPATLEEACESTIHELAPALGGWKELNHYQAVGHLKPDSAALFPFGGLKRDFIVRDDWPLLAHLAINDPIKFCPPTYSNFLKEEILEEDKIVDKRTRTIAGPNILWLLFQIFWLGDWSARLTAIGATAWGNMPCCGIAKGWSPMHTGHLWLRMMMNQFTTVLEADQSEWDACVDNELRWMIYRLRVRMYGGGNPLMAFYLFLIYFYDMDTFLVTKYGQLYRKLRGLCSGTFPTADDNTLIHIIVVRYILLRNCYRRGFFYLCLGDDLILGLMTKVALVIPYFECGFLCKIVKSYKRIDDGAHFLGMKYLPGGEFEFDWPTLLASLEINYHGSDAVSVLSKICSIAYLVVFQPRRFELLRGLYWFLVAQRSWLPTPEFPTRESAIELWNQF